MVPKIATIGICLFACLLFVISTILLTIMCRLRGFKGLLLLLVLPGASMPIIY